MRKYYLDNIRWITVVIVVLYHVFYMYNAEGVLGGIGQITKLTFQPYDIFQYLVYPWFMPILFIVAGISSRLYLDKHTNKDFIKSRTTKLLVPSTIGLFVFQFIQGYVSMHLSDGAAELVSMGVPKFVMYLIMVASGSGVLWFVHLLWIYSVVLVLVRKIEKGKILEAGSKTPLWLIVLFFFPIWGAAQILNAPIVAVYRVALYFVFFMLGYYVFSNEEVMDKMKKYAVIILVIGIALSITFAVLNLELSTLIMLRFIQSENIITSYRPMFYGTLEDGVIADLDNITSEEVLTHLTKATGETIDKIIISNDAEVVIIMIPVQSNKNIKKIIDTDSGFDLVDVFEKKQVRIKTYAEEASENTGYYVFIYDPKTQIGENVYKIIYGE